MPACVFMRVLHGESITDQASPRTPTQRTFQPQEAVQPQRNHTILQADTPAQKANYSYKRSHPTPLEADAHTSHVHKNAPARAQSLGGRPPSERSNCRVRTSSVPVHTGAVRYETHAEANLTTDNKIGRIREHATAC